MVTSIPFKKARWQTKLLHLLESTNVPDTYMDWDDGKQDELGTEITPEECRIRWKSVLNETAGMIGMQMVSNLLIFKLGTMDPHHCKFTTLILFF